MVKRFLTVLIALGAVQLLGFGSASKAFADSAGTGAGPVGSTVITPPSDTSVVPVVNAPLGSVVRITSINGAYNINHATVIGVQPGDIVNLSADLIDPSNGQALNDAVTDFIWLANDGTNNPCDAAQPALCASATFFRVTNQGVSYYVPANMPNEIVITVYSHNPSAVDASSTPITDTLTLENVNAQPLPPPVYEPPIYAPPPVVIVRPPVRPPIHRPPVIIRPPVRPPVIIRPPVRPPVIVRPPVRPPVIVRPPVNRPPVIRPPVRPPVVVRPPVNRPTPAPGGGHRGR